MASIYSSKDYEYQSASPVKLFNQFKNKSDGKAFGCASGVELA
jgi:hypothetical protein